MPTPMCRSRPGGVRVGQQVVRQHAVQVEDGVAVEADLLGFAHQKLDRVLVIEDHLRFELVLAFGLLRRDRSGAWCRAANRCCPQGGLSSTTGRSAAGSESAWRRCRPAGSPICGVPILRRWSRSFSERYAGRIGAVAVEKFPVISGGLARLRRLSHVFLDEGTLGGDRHEKAALFFDACLAGENLRHGSWASRHLVPGGRPLAFLHQSPGGHEQLEAVLECAQR